jgi:hypothetical protein
MEGNRFAILNDITDDEMTTPRTKRTLNDRSPENDGEARSVRQKKTNVMTICEKVGKGMDELKGQLVKTRRLINDKTSWKDAKDSFLTMFDTVVDTVEINANAITDVAAMADKYETEIEKKDRTIGILTERVKELERRKDSQEIRTRWLARLGRR